MSGLRTLSTAFRDYRKAVQNLGALQAVLYKTQKFRSRYRPKGEHLVLYSKHSRFPLTFRSHTSDVDAFSQIFVAREYRCLDDLPDAPFIIDCGANVGYASAYFLSRFPKAYVVAVEPDPENFSLLKKNLAPYEGRYRAICSAIWSRNAGLVFSEAPFGDGREWSRTVREAKAGEEPAMTASDIGTLFRDAGVDRIAVLKIDIEGSEVEVFSSSEHREWIQQVDNLVIELHGSECRSAFLSAIASENFSISRCDELTVCKRQPLRVP
jgi:FkbM family methyltransferase